MTCRTEATGDAGGSGKPAVEGTRHNLVAIRPLRGGRIERRRNHSRTIQSADVEKYAWQNPGPLLREVDTILCDDPPFTAILVPGEGRKAGISQLGPNQRLIRNSTGQSSALRHKSEAANPGTPAFSYDIQ